jgi:hypothetical protein
VTGDARLEVPADAGVPGLEKREGVAHRLAGPLVRRRAAGVGAAAARLIEIHRGAVPEGVAGALEVHVGGQQAVEPGVPRQVRGRLAVDVRQVVIARAGSVRVAGAARSRRRAVGAAAGAQRDVPGLAIRLRNRAAPISDPDVAPAQVDLREASRIAVVAAGVGRLRRAVGDVDIRERLDHLRIGIGRGIDAAGYPGLQIDVAVGERQDAAGPGVHFRLPGGGVAGVAEFHLPDQPMIVAAPRRPGVGLGRPLARGQRRHEFQRAGIDDLPELLDREAEGLDGRRERRGAIDLRRGARPHLGDPLGAELDDVAVVDAEEDLGALHRHAAMKLLELDEPELFLFAHVDRALGIEPQLEIRYVQQLGEIIQESAHPRLDVLRVRAAGMGQLEVGRCDPVPAAGQQRDAGAFDQVGPAAAGIPAHLPGVRLECEKALQSGVGQGLRGAASLDLQRRLDFELLGPETAGQQSREPGLPIALQRDESGGQGGDEQDHPEQDGTREHGRERTSPHSPPSEGWTQPDPQRPEGRRSLNIEESLWADGTREVERGLGLNKSPVGGGRLFPCSWRERCQAILTSTQSLHRSGGRLTAGDGVDARGARHQKNSEPGA